MLPTSVLSLQMPNTVSTEGPETLAISPLGEDSAPEISQFVNLWRKLSLPGETDGSQQSLSALITPLNTQNGETLPLLTEFTPVSAQITNPEQLSGDALLAYLMANAGGKDISFALTPDEETELTKQTTETPLSNFDDEARSLSLPDFLNTGALLERTKFDGADAGISELQKTAETISTVVAVEQSDALVVENTTLKVTSEEASLAQDNQDNSLAFVEADNNELSVLLGEPEVTIGLDVDESLFKQGPSPVVGALQSKNVNDLGSSVEGSNDEIAVASALASALKGSKQETTTNLNSNGVGADNLVEPDKLNSTGTGDPKSALDKPVLMQIKTAPGSENVQNDGPLGTKVLAAEGNAPLNPKLMLNKEALAPDTGSSEFTLERQETGIHNQPLSHAHRTPIESVMKTQAEVTGQPAKLAMASTALADKIHTMVSKEIRHAFIRLDPPELGALEIRVQVHNDQTQVHIVTQSALVREALESQSARLREAMAEQGMNLSNLDVSDQRPQQQSQEQGYANAGGDAEMDELAATETSVTVQTSSGMIDQYV
ncbi:flagellar hook-length control protein FliK [Reinekea sp. G2M2-21]|uniref:flagellar hook-length control protein FliK n=1 Tax=Reinekea sp. G2M2-21 TaxID=2788942 RepID=UPI0018AA72DA|nr:flagellar hook-length control protein FliK [Reinekea sp. G2M2-21]